MVGGKVVEVQVCRNRVWVNCQDTYHPTSFCAIYVERNARSERINPGDSVWWQGRTAMWTPASSRPPVCQHREHYSCGPMGPSDIEIPRIGWSGAQPPPREEVEERRRA